MVLRSRIVSESWPNPDKWEILAYTHSKAPGAQRVSRKATGAVKEERAGMLSGVAFQELPEDVGRTLRRG